MDVRKISLIIVGVIWLIVGLVLSTLGINWLITLKLGPVFFTFTLLSLIVGLIKGKFVLKKAAEKYYKNSQHITFNKIDILTGWAKVLGLKGFILIGLMIAIGSFLRHSTIDRPILGVVYLAVGVALVYASKIFFVQKSK